ncbi:DUF6056 family protein [Streptomyces sp. IBSNAI002]|uniref:DUF6056 family protein n=1 Tax=Streptomyces sp. IBSNAI002 TaxID=3457500 RepID=UPI003FCEFE43
MPTVRSIKLTIPEIVKWAPAVMLAAGVFLLCAQTSYVRPIADDWCYIADMDAMSAFGLAENFYSVGNGRFINGLVVGAYAEAGLFGLKVFPIILAAFTLVTFWLLFDLAVERFGARLPSPVKSSAPRRLVFFAAQPNPYQTFYWSAGVVTHTVPPVVAVSFVLWAHRSKAPLTRAICLVGTFGGGLAISLMGEETGLVLVAFLVVYLVAFPWRRNVFAGVWSVTAMAGLVSGVAILATSPGSRDRSRSLAYGGVQLGVIADGVVDWLRIMGTILTTWGYLLALMVGLFVSLFLQPPAPRSFLNWKVFVVPVAAQILASLLAVILVRVSLGEIGYQVSRTWNDFLLGFVLVLVWCGLLIGIWLRSRNSNILTERILKNVTSIGLCAISWHFLFILLQLGQVMEVRAQKWDYQNTRIVASIAAKGPVVYSPLSIAGLTDAFSPGERGWVRECVARYYGISSIARG